MMQTPIAVGHKLNAENVHGITQTEIENYAVVSGDRNPIHTDAAIVKDAGLEGVPVQGMLIMALVSKYLENWQLCNTIKKLDMRFVAPTISERDFTITARVVSVSEHQNGAILRIAVHQNDKLVCMGEAEVVYLENSASGEAG